MKELFYILLIGAMVPFVVYFAVKFGTYAFYAGRRRFNEDCYGENPTSEKTEEGEGVCTEEG